MNINNKKAILTFDYEVFLGHNTGTIENCVILPTQSILKILIKNNAKAIFFVDATWLLFIKKNFFSDFQRIIEQLKAIKESGSTIELHLHPQWQKAYRIGENIAFKSFNNYKLQSLNQREILDLFKESIGLLESITNQKVRCFRAGGFCIEPFNQIKKAFETFGIKYDFSVVPGTYLKENKIYDFDFSNSPRSLFYNFQNDVQKPEINGCFIEVPLSTYKNNPVYRLLNKVLLIINNDTIFGDGQGIQEKPFLSLRSLYQRLQFSCVMLSIDKISNLFFKFLLNTHFRRSSFLVIISHPKTISKQALINLSYVLKNYNTLNSYDLDNLFNNNN